jgi:hypothetical protein
VNDDAAVGGPSYPRSYRVAATLAVLGIAAGAWATREPLLRLEWTRGALLLMLGGIAIVAAGYGHILRSRTVLRGDAIEHGWLWVERIAWRDVTQVHLLHWPALAWLIAPRLVLRAQGIGRRRVPLADARVLARVRARLNG